MAFRLPRLPVNWKEQPQLFERYWDETLTNLEKTLNAILDIPAIQAAVTAAQAAAVTAKAAADSARNVADNQVRETSIVNSYTSVATGSVLTVDAAGTVTVQTHTRTYGNSTLNPPVSVTGASVSTTAIANDIIRIYYTDASRSGGTVSYQYTIDPTTPPVQTGDIHVVGAVRVPATGTTPGIGVTPPGYIDSKLLP